MQNVSVKYGDRYVLKQLDWTVKAGEHWAVVGPNGAGKTSLLRLVDGDHPQAYANAIELFGRPRGSGESIWEIKRRIGRISWELQIRYRKAIGAQEVVLSGFFDSVGLYRRCTPQQVEAARHWMRQLGIGHISHRRFDTLSHGEQRRVLLARAMVKSPRLLILDEPCEGLDRSARAQLLEMIDGIGRWGQSQILYVTHHPEEMLTCITHELRFVETTFGYYRAEAAPVHTGSGRGPGN
jgi:molybdate transport system ATP-binding protein